MLRDCTGAHIYTILLANDAASAASRRSRSLDLKLGITRDAYIAALSAAYMTAAKHRAFKRACSRRLSALLCVYGGMAAGGRKMKTFSRCVSIVRVPQQRATSLLAYIFNGVGDAFSGGPLGRRKNAQHSSISESNYSIGELIWQYVIIRRRIDTAKAL